MKKNIPLEIRADGKLGCKLVKNEGLTQFCSANRRDCQYIEQGIVYTKGTEEFYICTLNFNSWPYRIHPKEQTQQVT